MEEILHCNCSESEPDMMDDDSTSGYFLQCPVCGWMGPIEPSEDEAIESWNDEMMDAE